MNDSCIILNTLYYLQLFITDSDGNPKSGLNTSYTIYRCLDNASIASGVLTDLGNGVYKGTYTFSELGQFYIIYTTPSGYSDEIESVIVNENYAKSDDLLRVLGLSDENKRILETVHDENGNITSAIVKIYPSATDFENDTNVLATYEFSATYNANGLMQTMGIKRAS